MADTVVKIENLVKRYKDLIALDHLSLEIKEGETCSEEEINDFCLQLPRYKRPRKVIFDKVPRNPTGKIEKPVLREKYIGGRLVEEQITG